MMENDIKKISVSEEEIKKIVKRLGTQIASDFEGKRPQSDGRRLPRGNVRHRVYLYAKSAV